MATLYVSYIGGVQDMVAKEPCGAVTCRFLAKLRSIIFAKRVTTC
jgi:hypothetical protein